ncbi:DUF11 domain-containing protein [Planctomycetes bacterium Pan216]
MPPLISCSPKRLKHEPIPPRQIDFEIDLLRDAPAPPAPGRLELLPAPSRHVVGRPLLVIAKLTDLDGAPLSKASVSWELDGNAIFLATSGGDGTATSGKILTPTTATSTSMSVAREISDGNGRKVSLGPGDAWCLLVTHRSGRTSVRAVVEGDVPPCEHRIDWVDARIGPMPPSAERRAGRVVVNASVRRADGRPLAGYDVRLLGLRGLGGMVSRSNSMGEVAWVLPTRDFAGRLTAELLLPDGREGDLVVDRVPFEAAVAPAKVNLLSRREGSGDTPGAFEVVVEASVDDPRSLAEGTVVALLGEGLTARTRRGAEIALGQLVDENPLRRTLHLEAAADLTSVLPVRLAVRDQANELATRDLSLPNGRPKISVVRRGPTRWRIGQPQKYRLVIRNEGDQAAREVELSEQLPGGVSADVDGRQVENGINWSLDTLAAGEERHLDVIAIAHAAMVGHPVVTRIAAKGIPARTSTSEFEVPSWPALRVEVDDLEDPVRVQGEIRYWVKIENRGDGVARDVAVEAHLSKGLRLLRVRGSLALAMESASTAAVTIPRLDPGEIRSCQLVVAAPEVGEHRLSVRVNHDSHHEAELLEQESTIVSPLLHTNQSGS